MLNTILSISGKPGLFRLLSQGRGNLIVESLVNGKRQPIMGRERVMSLGDISMYTESEDVALSEVLTRAYEAYEGKTIDLSTLSTADALVEAFAKVLPTFDRERVYTSDIKKLFTWYNILVTAGFTTFTEATDENETPAE